MTSERGGSEIPHHLGFRTCFPLYVSFLVLLYKRTWVDQSPSLIVSRVPFPLRSTRYSPVSSSLLWTFSVLRSSSQKVRMSVVFRVYW